MEGLLILLVVLVVFAPVVLSIVALALVASTRRRMADIETRMAARPSVASSPASASPAPGAPSPEGPAPSGPRTVAAPPLPAMAPPLRKRASKGSLELVLGGKVSSYAGIAVLITGIALLVGYAVRNAWVGPGARIVLGLVSGGILVVFGHLAEVRGRGRLRILARSLTGGGAALFYFCVFAAYGVYHLVGPWIAGAGLLVSALVTLSLSMVYRSQAVAVVGIIGAFVMPLLIGGEFEKGAFPLVYIALINLPVIVLGLRRNWQVLYNLAFLFTVGYAIGWMDWMRGVEWLVALGFVLLFFLEFAVLGLIKLRGERRVSGRAVDLLRLTLNSLLFMGALYWVMDAGDQDRWTGAAFLAAAVLHIALVRVAWRWLPAYREDTLGLLVGGLSFASLALPIQLDGAWVSLGWGIEGLILCWFALRSGSRCLLGGAVLMGSVGLLKSLLYDFDLYAATPLLFLNGRFVSGLLCALLLGAQARLMRRSAVCREPGKLDWSRRLVPAVVFAVTLVMLVDCFWTLGADDPWSWLLSTTMVMVAAVFTLLLADREHGFTIPALALIGLLPLKILADYWMFFARLNGNWVEPFVHGVFWGEAIIAILAVYVCTSVTRRSPFTGMPTVGGYGACLNILSLVAFIGVVTGEFGLMRSDAGSTGITIWWAVAALGLALFGLIRDNARHRYLALVLFGMTLLKVFFVDLSDLAGLHRIAAFLGLGVLLLVLSYFYQRLAARLARGSEGGERTTGGDS